jgi:hypothetical protein
MRKSLISRALDCLGHGVAHVLGLQYDPNPEPPSPLPSRFSPGDWVILKKKNPYKGTLVAGKAYLVQAGSHPCYVRLKADNETVGVFSDDCFVKLDYDPDPPGAREYDEIMLGNEIMDALGD